MEGKMEIRLFQYVIEVYKMKSFTKAAANLHIAQPSLSKQISKLEDELGILLFNRYSTGIEITEKGKLFVVRAQAILRMHDNLQKELEDSKNIKENSITIGVTPITGGHVLPPLLKQFMHQYQTVKVKFLEDSSENILKLLVNAKVDFALLSLPIKDERLKYEPFLTEALYLAVPKNSPNWLPPLSNRLTDYESCPFILLKSGFDFRSKVLSLCANHQFQPAVAYETSSIETAQALVLNGLGVTIVPEMVIKHDNPSTIRYIKLEHATRTLVFAHVKDFYLSQASKNFIHMAKSTEVSTFN